MDTAEQLTDIKKIEGALEAILFAAGHPVEYERLAATLSLTPHDARLMAEHLASRINDDTSRGIMMLLFENSCQLCTREDYSQYIRDALGIRRGGNLSNSSLEVLAIIAYNQPVTRSFVDTVRGVDSAYAVSSLIDKELIAACGRLDAPGRPMLFGTTEKFLRVFGLGSLADLPEAESVLAAVDALSQTDEPAAEDENTAAENESAAAEDENTTAADESTAGDGVNNAPAED